MGAIGGTTGWAVGASPEDLANKINDTVQGLVESVGLDLLRPAAGALGIDFDVEPLAGLDAARDYISSGREIGPVEGIVLAIALLGAAHYQLAAAASGVYEQECGEATPSARAWTYYYGGRRFRTCNHSPSHTREE